MADELGVVPGPQVEIFLQHDALCRVPGLLGFGDMHVRLACRTHEVLTIAAAEGYRPCEYIGLRKCTGGQAMPSVLVTGANRGLGFEFAGNLPPKAGGCSRPLVIPIPRQPFTA